MPFHPSLEMPALGDPADFAPHPGLCLARPTGTAVRAAAGVMSRKDGDVNGLIVPFAALLCDTGQTHVEMGYFSPGLLSFYLVLEENNELRVRHFSTVMFIFAGCVLGPG